MSSVLEQEYVEPSRPYSQNELQHLRTMLYKSLRLGKVRAQHKNCNHFYLVKENGRKEKEMQEQKSLDVGNCSVCWKQKKTPRNLNTEARNMVNQYCNAFLEEPKYMTYNLMDLEAIFYTWLYTEFI